MPPSGPDFHFQPMFERGEDHTEYRKITSEGVSTTEFEGRTILKVDSSALTALTAEAIRDISHLFRSSHLKQLAKILEDPEASDNDRFVARELLKNANISAGMVLPSCQDTGTAIVIGKKGQNVFTEGNDEESLSRGVYQTYNETNLRYSQMAPLTMYEEKNTGTNLPAQIEIYATEGEDAYKFLFIAKGGGSANKTLPVTRSTRVIAQPTIRMIEWVGEKIKILTLGTAACPPYHLAIVIGGTSAEMTLKTVKLASDANTSMTCRPRGSEDGHAPSATSEMEGEDPRS